MKFPLLAHILALLRRLGSRWRIALAQGTGVHIGPYCLVGVGVDINLGLDAPRRGSIEIGERCELCQRVVFHPYGGFINLGQHVYVGQHAVIFGHGGVEIGDHTLIAMHCRILSSNHTIPPMDTTIRSQPDLIKPTKIGSDVWLGAGVTVLGGVTIGDGCVVGAGAIVSRDLPAGAIAAGMPARVIKHRAGFSDSSA